MGTTYLQQKLAGLQSFWKYTLPSLGAHALNGNEKDERFSYPEGVTQETLQGEKGRQWEKPVPLFLPDEGRPSPQKKNASAGETPYGMGDSFQGESSGNLSGSLLNKPLGASCWHNVTCPEQDFPTREHAKSLICLSYETARQFFMQWDTALYPPQFPWEAPFASLSEGTFCKEGVGKGFIVAGKETLTAGFDVALAFSGGVDSRFLAHSCHLAGKEPLLFHLFGPQSIAGESQKALEWAWKNGFTVICLFINPLKKPEVSRNDVRRCYFCKKQLFEIILSWSGSLPVVDGTLMSDKHSYRPGLQALHELGILSPLAEVGFDKSLVIEAGRMTGLTFPTQPSQSCLLTRFRYEMSIDTRLLRHFFHAEKVVRNGIEQQCKCYGILPPFYALRFLDAENLVLHIEPIPRQHGGTDGLSEGRASSFLAELERVLQETIAAHELELPRMRLEVVSRVQGFFDSERGEKAP